MYGLAQVVDPVYPMPPHCPYSATDPPAGDVVGAVPGAVVGAELPDEALNLEFTKVNAAWPYSLPYPWCVAALLPLQQYGSDASQ